MTNKPEWMLQNEAHQKMLAMYVQILNMQKQLADLEEMVKEMARNTK